eukprot:CAMPEP_0197021754 /NCGR_PEP_ID=MMETSP1384-20130603/2687_1 /TAXON_ID=29189 /ORGANISM="Ammonia sp." /LENGTH=383 /DNA_ID=CAMNT_0042449659 /DNA_START=5 /DNA_END=1156 /DNA_ORIENTATION=-
MASSLLLCVFLSSLWSYSHAFQPSATTTTDEIIKATDVNLEGKLAIVTGASSGLGRETTRSLILLGCKVVMAVRDVEKGKVVRDQILDDIVADRAYNTRYRRSELRKKMEIRRLDLNTLQSVLDFAKNFYVESSGIKLDYLILNAGIMALPQYDKTVDGYEKQIGVNYLSQYYLARLLVNKLSQQTIGVKGNQPGRVILVSSRAHKYAPEPIEVAVDDLEKALKNPRVMKIGYEAWSNYGISKSFQILFARELQRQMKNRNIVAVALHPGVIQSGLQRHLEAKRTEQIPFDKDIKQGAATQLWCVLMPVEELQGGGYYDDCELHNDRLREDLQAEEGYLLKSDEEVQGGLEWRLWQVSESLVVKKGFTFNFRVPVRDEGKEEL